MVTNGANKLAANISTVPAIIVVVKIIWHEMGIFVKYTG